MPQKIFIVEHLEPELWPWCLIEYKNISKIIGKNNLWFTNIKKDFSKLKNYGKVFQEKASSLNLKNPCILNSYSKETLTTKKSNQFQYFIFGGILGDNPPKKRTSELINSFKKIKTFNIGKKQIPTDNAVYVVSRIIKGESLKKIKFQDGIEIKINKIESTILPYRYALIENKPLLSRELIKYLKKN